MSIDLQSINEFIRFDREFCAAVEAIIEWRGQNMAWPIVAIRHIYDQDYGDELKKAGYQFAVRSVEGIYGSGLGECFEYRYHSAKLGHEIYAYVLVHQDIDTWAETIIAVRLPLANADVGDLFQAEKDAYREFGREAEQKLKALEGERRFWRMINNNFMLHPIAWRLAVLGRCDAVARKAIKHYGAAYSPDHRPFVASLMAYGRLMRAKINDPRDYWLRFRALVKAKCGHRDVADFERPLEGMIDVAG